MKIIGWHLLRLTAEAGRDLVGMTVESIRRDATHGRFLLILGSSRGKRYLVLGTRTHSAFIWSKHKTDIHGFGEYMSTESFNRLRGRRLTSVVMPGPDRLVELHWAKSGPDGAEDTLLLIVSWTGAAGNLWLVDPTDRGILEYGHRPKDGPPRAMFVAPPVPALADWRTLTFSDYLHLRRQNADLPAQVFWHRHIWGIDAALARQIAQQMTASTQSEATVEPSWSPIYWREFENLVGTLRMATAPDGTIFLPADDWNAEHIRVAAAADMVPDQAVCRPLAGLLALCDLHAGREVEGKDSEAALNTAIDRRRNELGRRVAALQQAIDREGEARQWQHCCELLNAYRQLLRRGMPQLNVADWETGTSISIPLDPALGPQENIAAAHERARRLRRAAERARSQIDAVRREHERWTRVSAAMLDKTPSETLVAEVSAELGLSRPSTRPRVARPEPRLPYREFAIGIDRVWVGRSSRDNDTLTLHHARPDDLFLHAQACPGSHVILKRRQRGIDFDQQTIVAAAQIAAFFSRAKHAGLVPVVYAEVRHVKKPCKSAPGTVRLEREKSVMVAPLPPPGYHAGGETTQ
ncbi:MAG: NFACT RNA binding domain-containing protein [Candidatus Zixiibacteriota bacterium]